MKSVTVAAIKIVYGAVFPNAGVYPSPEVAVKQIKQVRMDSDDLFCYANAISNNVEDNYYEVLSKQLQHVIADRDMCRATARMQAKRNVPANAWVQSAGRGTRAYSDK